MTKKQFLDRIQENFDSSDSSDSSELLLEQSASIIEQLTQILRERTGCIVRLQFVANEPLVFLQEPENNTSSSLYLRDNSIRDLRIG
jgi:hypothetical protein